MFRQEEAFLGGWQEKTLDALRRRRFDQRVALLPALGAGRIEHMSSAALARRLEHCWQDVERKPMRAQQETAIIKAVLGSVKRHADCLSHEEHELVERALILGGCARIEDAAELEAAGALALRLWGSVGLISGKPYLELEPAVLRPVATAFARPEHEAVRRRFEAFHARMTGALYRVGAMDDRQPQRTILRDVLGADMADEAALQLARRFLWASYDCVDYCEGVLLVHSAVADPRELLPHGRRASLNMQDPGAFSLTMDILPEEIPLQCDLERAIGGALREGYQAGEVARTIRFLCKQGAPLTAMQEVLQDTLIVYLTDAMRGALANMYLQTPKWIECSERGPLQ